MLNYEKDKHGLPGLLHYESHNNCTYNFNQNKI